MSEAIAVSDCGEVPLRTQAPLVSRSRAIAANRLRSSPCTTSARRKRTKAVRSGVSSSREKPQKRRKLARSESDSANATSERSYQVASSAFEHRQRRPGLQIRTRPIDQGGKRVEARLALGCCAEPKGFLADPPLRHDRRLPKKTTMRRTESRPATHCKHLKTLAHRSRNIFVRLRPQTLQGGRH